MADSRLWLHQLRAAADPRARLFCFPHAGGHSAAFRSWPAGLPENLEIIGVQLPGRATRLREPPVADMSALVDGLVEALSGHLDGPFIFFGHSMGAMLATAVTHALFDAGAPVPVQLIVSGRRGPRVPPREPALSSLSDSSFIREMMNRYGGIPAELLRHADVMELLLPAMRADIAALEGYTLPERRLPIPISAFGGSEDRLITRADLAAWEAETDDVFQLRMFPGGHFYHDEQRAAVLAEVASILSRVPSRALEAHL